MNDEAPAHLLFECIRTDHLFNELQSFCYNELFFPALTPQMVKVGISIFPENSLLLNHLFLIFKYYVYNAREDVNLGIELLKANIYKAINIEMN